MIENLQHILPIVLQASLALLMVALGLRGTPHGALWLVRRPAAAARAMIAMFVIVPILAIALAHFFDLHPAVKIALVMLAISPMPPTLPGKAMKAGGTADHVVGLVVLATLVACVVIPLALVPLSAMSGLNLSMDPVAVVKLVLPTLFVPLGVGMLVRAVAPAFAERAAKPVSTVATIMLIAVFLPALIHLLPAIGSLIGGGAIIAFTVLCVLAVAVGHWLGGPGAEGSELLALFASTRHPGISIALAHAFFPEQKLVAPAVILFLIVGAVVTKGYLAWIKRRGTSP